MPWAMAETHPVKPPDERYTGHRTIARRWQDWAHESDRIMMEHGEVEGSIAYKRRHQARWRAQRLIDLMLRMGLHQRWQIRERTWETPDGWCWSVEYIGRNGDG